jgi:hypothetical protein
MFSKAGRLAWIYELLAFATATDHHHRRKKKSTV